jgi:dienelactone hydrolase
VSGRIRSQRNVAGRTGIAGAAFNLACVTSLVLALCTALFPMTAKAGEWVTYVVDGESFEGYRAAAKGEAKGLVIVIHDWNGVDDYEARRADMLAESGYDAFAIDLFGKGNRPASMEAKKKETGRLLQHRARMRRLLLGGLAEARKGSSAETVVMGYCFGGGAALELARSGNDKDIAGYATFHGALKTPEGQSYASSTPPIFIAHGGADSSVSMDDVASLSRELEGAGVKYEIHVYSQAPHAFTVFGSERYQKEADERSWQAFLDFLGRTLKG